MKIEKSMVCDEERKKAFVVFASTYEAAKYLTLEQKGELFEKLGAYSLEGKDVHSDNPMVDIILISAFPNMDAAERRHQTAIKNGQKGKEGGGGVGRPYKGETTEEYQARVSEWRKSQDLGNPQKPLNTNRNNNIDNDIDKNIKRNIDTHIEIKKETDIDNNTNVKKNTNVELISNSISVNESKSCSSQSSLRETTSQEDTGSKEVFEDDPNVDELDESAGNYLGSIEEIMRGEGHSNLTPPNTPILLQREPSKNEIIAAIRSEVDAAIDCKQEGQPYIEHMYNARDIYMKFKRCNKERAQEDLSWLYQLRKRGESDFLANMI